MRRIEPLLLVVVLAGLVWTEWTFRQPDGIVDWLVICFRLFIQMSFLWWVYDWLGYRLRALFNPAIRQDNLKALAQARLALVQSAAFTRDLSFLHAHFCPEAIKTVAALPEEQVTALGGSVLAPGAEIQVKPGVYAATVALPLVPQSQAGPTVQVALQLALYGEMAVKTVEITLTESAEETDPAAEDSGGQTDLPAAHQASGTK